MSFVIDPDGWGACAIAEAINWLQREQAIGRGLAEVDAQAFTHMLFQFTGAHGLACFGTAKVNHVFPRRLTSEIMVKTHYAVNFRTGKTQSAGHHRHRIGWNETKSFLNRVQNRH